MWKVTHYLQEQKSYTHLKIFKKCLLLLPRQPQNTLVFYFSTKKAMRKKKHIVREPGQRPFRSESSVMLGPTTFPKIIFEN